MTVIMSNGVLQITSEEAWNEEGKIQLFNVEGELLQEGRLNNGEAVMKVSQSGIYLLFYSDEQQRYSKKIIVQ